MRGPSMAIPSRPRFVTSPRGLFAFLLSSAFLAGGGCQGEPRAGSGDQPEAEPAQELGPPFSMTLAGVGFETPESALHDPAADVYLVSNINGSPGEKDGNGFISRVTPDGRVEELRWIDGTLEEVNLDAPKGMALVGDTLFVTDIDCVRRFHRVTGAPGLAICLDEATFLNDLASDPRGDLYISDSGGAEGAGAVYVKRNRADVPRKVGLADGTVLEGEDLGGPNGLVADDRGLFVATYRSGEVFRITPEGERVTLLPPSEMSLDGLVSLEERGFLFSSWPDSAVYWTTPDGTVSPLVEGVEAPADIGYDAQRNRVLIPLFQDDELLIREVRLGG